MSGWKAKRFWKEATVTEAEGGFRIELDGRPVRSPAKTLVVVPTKALAETIAAEWDAQIEEIHPESMPVTRLANSALDKVAVQFAEVADMLAAYGDSDLLCYRADTPQELIERQNLRWNPILDWLEQQFGVRLVTGAGIMPVEQSAEGQEILRQEVRKLSAFELSAFHDIVSISGSLALALAVIKGSIEPEEAWDISRLDETWQEEQWGPDDEATEISSRKKADFLTACSIFRLLNLA